MNVSKKNRLKIAVQWLLLAALAVLLIFALWGIFMDFRTLPQSGQPNPVRVHRHWFGSQNISAQPQEITGWMTFRYINLVFRLPQDYLKNSLNITDARYPNLTIDSVAKQQKKTSSQETVQTIGAVQKFLTPTPAAK